ncbi:TatD family hydrolase [Spizellomyces punctatus DAOM BR117]|uniref:TatD family hydrolase n=1 Tax=Spizellomyces punctatus (strain DAOM BR117) TaxID=645134 RepID=A0A0L0HTJ8_SPIPD|nr:TatD family hydrolase [Spizellomyces punctatus DAOM BR117]KND04189.1 TatD family hydrolase [Spizellomyces punctatus DAOM BR117]|eukprot:XP_016612228.1 TatD family hydrolase [Spizellomyces punctatus DAOM BR117]
MLIDCHAHLYPPQFPSDTLHSVLQRAETAGVTSIINVPETLEDAKIVLELAATHKILQPCVGLHPVQPSANGNPRSVRADEVQPVLDLIQRYSDRIVAIGECGLDFSPHVFRTIPSGDIPAQRDAQKQVFAAQIRLAKELNIPLNVHSRQAGHYAVDMMVEAGVTGLLHAFDGKVGSALKAVQNGCMLSVAAHIGRNPHLQKLVKALPLDALVLETDAPALAPEPGMQNVPANITIACETLANIKEVTVDMVQEVTTYNARRLFPRIVMNNCD